MLRFRCATGLLRLVSMGREVGFLGQKTDFVIGRPMRGVVCSGQTIVCRQHTMVCWRQTMVCRHQTMTNADCGETFSGADNVKVASRGAHADAG
ncbi:hypothetical protein [uncultured Alloprevotella sp.]|uniref:hypothetical protein n=1 Tax=uncultured Alloprevotella sp. TaxID=1283315 RepID=UPI00260C2267|nr:hypothetical protein [uncultured Alloprevotella sp.]